MQTLQTNDFIILNTIIYEIYTIENFQEMRRRFLEQMKMVLDFDGADFYLAARDGEKHLECPVTYNCEQDLSSMYDEIDYSRGIMYSGKSLVYRETDIIADEKRVQTEYYKKVYRPNNWHYSLQMVIAREKKFLGVITFYRNIGKDDFKYDDIFILDMLKDHMAYRLFKSQPCSGTDREKITVSEAAGQYELTRQEHTILRFLMEGKENPDICGELSISANTLKKHIRNIYRKLEIKNRVQLFKMIKERE